MVKNLPVSTGDGRDPWAGKIPWRRTQHPTPGFVPGKSHGLRSLAGYSPRVVKSQTFLSGRKEGKDKAGAGGRAGRADEWQALNHPVSWAPPSPHTDEAFVSFLVSFPMSRARVTVWVDLHLGQKGDMCLTLNSRDRQE